MIWKKLKELFEKTASVEAIFHPEWVVLLKRHLPLYPRLPADLREKLHERIAGFISTTRFESCNGLELTEGMIVSVAAQACMLVLHREGEPYPELRVVYLYPTTFNSVQKNQTAYGVVTEEKVHRLGESWENGTVVLAWDSVKYGAQNIQDGHNVTLHEFAHQLDHEDGATDGAPGLSSRQAYRTWAAIFSKNYEDFQKQLKRGRKTVIDDYGGTNPAEFFAVATETFFEKPKQLKRVRSGLYEALRDYYQLDPLEWLD